MGTLPSSRRGKCVTLFGGVRGTPRNSSSCKQLQGRYTNYCCNPYGKAAPITTHIKRFALGTKRVVVLESLVYADKPQTLDHLEDNIRRVIADLRPQRLEKVIENWTSRLDYIRASRGSHMPEIMFKM
ncbi:hypothetical protein TNCV_2624921 [Trichonephila clavipes]|nr:hypothetical protein TNCV_2624921 [Trichonephila clavipes]